MRMSFCDCCSVSARLTFISIIRYQNVQNNPMKRPVANSQQVNQSWQSSGSSLLPTRMFTKPPSTAPMPMDTNAANLANRGSMPSKMAYGMSFMKSPQPPAPPMAAAPTMKKPQVNPMAYEEEKRRRMINDSDAAIEGLMFLKASTQMAGETPYGESPMKRQRTAEMPPQNVGVSRMSAPVPNFNTNFTSASSAPNFPMPPNPTTQLPPYQTQRRPMPDQSKPSDVRILQFNGKDPKVNYFFLFFFFLRRFFFLIY